MPIWPVTIWIVGGSNTHGGKALPYIAKIVWGPEGWGYVGTPTAGYMSLEASAVDAAGVVWAAGSVRSNVGVPPSYHWTTDTGGGYALTLRPGWIPWAYEMLAGWVLEPSYNSGGILFPYPGYRLVRRGDDLWTYAPPL